MLRQLIPFSIIFLLSCATFAQGRRNVNNNYYVQKKIGIGYYSGYLISQHQELDSLKKGFVNAFEVDLCLGTNGTKYWHGYYKYPSFGFTFMYTDFDYLTVLGNSLSISSYVKFPLVSGKVFSINLKTGAGLALLNKRYDSLQNPKNIAISTHLNGLINVGLITGIKLGDRSSFDIGVNALHFSNGSIKKPNYGLNLMTVSSTLYIYLNTFQKIPPYLKFQKKEKQRWFITLSGAVKETGDPGGSLYGVGSISLEYNRPWKRLLRYGGVFDVMYDDATFYHLDEDSVSYSAKYSATKVGAGIQFEMALDRLSAFAACGVYLYNIDKQVGPLYQRVGLRYRLSSLIYTQLALKTHLNHADYLEFGVAFNFNANIKHKKTYKDYKHNTITN